MNDVLLTVSGVIAPDAAAQAARGERPRPDYLELARALDADLLDYAAARQDAGAWGWLLERLGGAALLLAWACWRRRGRYAAIISDGEQVGIPLALLLKLGGLRRRPRHIMIVHVLSVKKKMVFFDLFRIQHQIDRMLVYSTWQQHFIINRWKLPPEQVVWTPFMVDTAFFAPEHAVAASARPQICAVGLERRDYPTLLSAVHGLGAQVVIAAASPWARQPDTTQGRAIPPNTTVQRFSQFALRQLYADSCFMVMPLFPVDFQAGVTAILEAMAMERAVICTRTPGQTDVIVEGETGIYVPPGDPAALRAAIDHLLEHPEEAARMGRNGRQRVAQLMSLAVYAEHVRAVVRATLAADEQPGAQAALR